MALVEHREELAHLLVDGELFADFENVKVAFRVGPEGERVGLSGLYNIASSQYGRSDIGLESRRRRRKDLISVQLSLPPRRLWSSSGLTIAFSTCLPSTLRAIQPSKGADPPLAPPVILW